MFKGVYAKAWVAFSGLVLLVAGTEFGVESKWYKYVVGGLTVAGVFFLPNANKAEE